MQSRTTDLVKLMLMFALVTSSIVTAQCDDNSVPLPEPNVAGGMPLSRALNERRCICSFTNAPLTLEEVAQLLWAGGGNKVDGVSGATRTAPSAGGLYPVEVFLVAGDVDGLADGLYTYDHGSHSLVKMRSGDLREDLGQAALRQRFVAEAPATIVIAAVFERTTRKYGRRGGERYVGMDAAHAAENIFLQATAFGLGTTTVGAFYDVEVKDLLHLDEAEPLYLMPMGIPTR